MFFILKSRYRSEKIELLGKIERLRKRLGEVGDEKVELRKEIEKTKSENKVLEQELKGKNLQIRELKEKLEDTDTRLKIKVEEKTDKYRERLGALQSQYDKLMEELKKR